MIRLTCPTLGETAAPDPDDVTAQFGFTRCKSTKADVEGKFGSPYLRNDSGPTGTTQYTYEFRGGSLIVIFLFTNDDLILRTVAYAHNQ